MYHADVTSQMLQWFRVIIFETEKKKKITVLGALLKNVWAFIVLKGERFPSLSRKVEWKRK